MAGGDKVSGVYSEVQYRFDRKSLKVMKTFKSDIMKLKKELASLNKMKIGSGVTRQASAAAQQQKTRLQKAREEMRLLNKSLDTARKKNTVAGKEVSAAQKAAKEASKESVSTKKALDTDERKLRVMKAQAKLQNKMKRAGIKGGEGAFNATFGSVKKSHLEGKTSRAQFNLAMEKMYQRLNPLIDKHNHKIRQQNQALQRSGRAMRNSWASIYKVAKAQERAARSTNKANMSFNKLRTTVASLTGAYSAFAAAQNINRIGQEFESAGVMMEVALGENAAPAMEFLIEQSQRLGIDAAANAKGFSRYALAAQNMGFTFDQVKEQFLGVAEAATVFGLTSEEIRGTIRALEQMASLLILWLALNLLNAGTP